MFPWSSKASRTGARTTLKASSRHPPLGSTSLCRTCVLVGATAILSFYIGLIVGTIALEDKAVEQEVQRRVREQLGLDVSVADDKLRFPLGVRDFMVGQTMVDRDDFASFFNLGIPLDPSLRQNQNVMLLYQTPSALPSDEVAATQAVTNGAIPTMTNVDEATANCDYLNLIFSDFSPKRRQCTALMGQYEAFHIQKYMRLPPEGAEEGRKLNAKLPLRFVNRGAQMTGRKSTNPPTKEQTVTYWAVLQRYLSQFDTVLAELQPLLESVAIQNTVIVLVCNFGQSELLSNFACAARTRGLDLTHILVFATDTETRDLSIGLGLTTFYDEVNYADMPKRAAGRYADKTFMSMMMAKVFCVHMVAWLGYDVLFQDVDVIWYKDPVPYFHNPDAIDRDFDMYFQDDGNHALYYAPFSSNTGFYYVRANERTRHFFNSFLLAGDLILSTRSHQVPLVALLQEHASMYGLRVKIFSRSEDDFPGGHAFHRRRDFMINIMKGESLPYIFHMSWTLNKNNKVKFFRQMGEWFLDEKCVQVTATDVLGLEEEASVPKDSLIEPCCLAEYVFSCHYRDKPSKRPCRDSPPIDKEARSFW